MMPKILVSIKDTREASIIKDLSIDIIDLKEISEPPMGFVGIKKIQDIKRIIPNMTTSVTMGNSKNPFTKKIVEAANEVVSSGINYMKIGLFSENQIINHGKFLKEINLNGCNPICVILIDDIKDIDYLDHLCEIGYKGVMLDTINKKRSRVFDLLSEKECMSFVKGSRRLGMTSGLAGSLALDDLSKLTKISPDFIGFRGQLCEKKSNRLNLDRNAVIELLSSATLSAQ